MLLTRAFNTDASISQIADVFDELLASLGEIASAGYYGVLCAMCTACERADDDLQESFLKVRRANSAF